MYAGHGSVATPGVVPAFGAAQARFARLPWAELVALIAPYAPQGKRGRPPFAVQTMLGVHFMQQWFTLSDPAMEGSARRAVVP